MSLSAKAVIIANHNKLSNNSFLYRWGSWKTVQYCSYGALALNCFRLRVSLKGSIQARITAGNNIDFECEGGQILGGIGQDGGSWGSWSAYCPVGICGIQTKVQPAQGSGDDTALNDVKFYCCK